MAVVAISKVIHKSPALLLVFFAVVVSDVSVFQVLSIVSIAAVPKAAAGHRGEAWRARTVLHSSTSCLAGLAGSTKRSGCLRASEMRLQAMSK